MAIPPPSINGSAKRGPWTWTEQFSHYSSTRRTPACAVALHDPKMPPTDFAVTNSVEESQYSIMKNQAHAKCTNQLNIHRMEQYEDLSRQIEALGGSEIYQDAFGEKVTRFHNDTNLLVKIGIVTQVVGSAMGQGRSLDAVRREEQEQQLKDKEQRGVQHQQQPSVETPPSMQVAFFTMHSAAGGLENQRQVRVLLKDCLSKQQVTGLYPGAMIAVAADILKKDEDFKVTTANAHKILLPSMPAVPWSLPTHLKSSLTGKGAAAITPNALLTSGPTKLRVQVCRGPFLKDVKSTIGVLQGAVLTAVQRTADLLVILGPFVVAANGSAMDPIPSESYDDIFLKYVEAIENSIPEGGCRLKVVVVPSPDDIILTSVMPQLGFNVENNENMFFATNPCTITMCGGIRLSVGGFDCVNHLNDCYSEKPRELKSLVNVTNASHFNRQQRILSTLMRNQTFVPILLGGSTCYSLVDYALFNKTKMTHRITAAAEITMKAEAATQEVEGDAVPAAAASIIKSANKNNSEVDVPVCPHILIVPSSGKPWAGTLDAVNHEDGKGTLAIVAGTLQGVLGSSTKLNRSGTGWALPISELTIGNVEKLRFEGFTEDSQTLVQTLLLEVKE